MAPGSGAASCGGGAARAVLTIDVPATDDPWDLFVTTHGQNVDTVISVFDGGCGVGELGCADDDDGLLTSALSLTGLAPGAYTIVVDSRTALSDQLDVHAYATPTSAGGDRCGRPLPFDAASVTGNNCSVAHDNDPQCEQTTTLEAGDAVYYYVVEPGSAGSHTFDTCTGCSTYDTSLELRSVCLGDRFAGRLACNDDGATTGPTCQSSCSGNNVGSRVTEDLAPGVYFVFVDGWAGSCGDYELTALVP